MKLLAGVLALAMVVPVANADTTADADEARAKRSYTRGKALAARGRYDEALAEFTTGYSASGRPQFLFNMGECARALGDVSHARQHYTHYLTEVPKGPLATIARRRIEALPAPLPPAPLPAPNDVADDTPVPSTRGAVDVVVLPTRPADERSAWKSPWPWVGAGVAVLAGSVAVYALSRDGGGCGDGCVDLR